MLTLNPARKEGLMGFCTARLSSEKHKHNMLSRETDARKHTQTPKKKNALSYYLFSSDKHAAGVRALKKINIYSSFLR